MREFGLALGLKHDSTVFVPRRFDARLTDIQRTDLAAMSREEVEAWGWRQHELARELANRLGADSRTSSRPPSSDDPYRRDERGDVRTPAAPPEKTGKPDNKKAGKQPGSKGFWRSQRIVTSADAPHAPTTCAACQAFLGCDLKRRCVSAHDSLELARGFMSLQVTATKHVYFAVRCHCGHETVARPGVGLSSEIEGAPAEPGAERALRWMWVATTALATIFRIGSRRKEELTELIGEAFLGWLVTDGYVAYRDHPRRQRCLAHLIRKGLALAEGYYGAGSGWGSDLVRDLRRLIERVHDGQSGETPAVKRLMARLKWNCQRNRYEDEKKVRELAGEILNDWDAIVAFVFDPKLPPTNNDAERALRHAVIARRISFGTRTDEGSRFYAAALSVIDTCRKRGVETWGYASRLIAAARAGLPMETIPKRAVA